MMSAAAKKAWETRKKLHGKSGMSASRVRNAKRYPAPSEAEMAEIARRHKQIAWDCPKCGALNWKDRKWASKTNEKKYGKDKCITCLTPKPRDL